MRQFILGVYMTNSRSPDDKALGDALRPIAYAANGVELIRPELKFPPAPEVETKISHIIAQKIQALVTTAPVVESDPPKLMRHLESLKEIAKKYHIKITDSVIPKCYMDLASDTIIMSKAFANERPSDQIKAHLIASILEMEKIRSPGRLFPKKIVELDAILVSGWVALQPDEIKQIDQKAAELAGTTATINDLKQLESDRARINQHINGALDRAHKAAKMINDLSDIIAYQPITEADRIENLNHQRSKQAPSIKHQKQ